jgi:head-tail adaptor
MIPGELLRELYAIESPTDTRNEFGEVVQTWTEVGRRRGSYEANSFSEVEQRGQVDRTISATVRIYHFPGLTGRHRLRWISRDNRILYLSSVVERGANRIEQELTVEESAP